MFNRIQLNETLYVMQYTHVYIIFEILDIVTISTNLNDTSSNQFQLISHYFNQNFNFFYYFFDEISSFFSCLFLN